MYDWLQRNERDMTDCGLGSPVEHLARNGMLGEKSAGRARQLSWRPETPHCSPANKVSVVHCPRSHFYFKHRPFPLATWLKAGVNVCLGTDSLATVYRTREEKPELNLFEEMRALAAAHPELSPQTILQMATVNGATALGLAGRIGELAKGSWADLIAIPFARKVSAATEAAINFPGYVRASMIDGKWAITPN